jgi:hypothetical protein
MAEQKPEEKRWYEHPLANLLLGFLLTGVLGTALTQHFMDRREREKLRAQAALDRKELVVTMSELLAAVQYHGELLAEAIDAGQSGKAIEERKREFEASYEAWRIQRGSALLLARDLMSDEGYRQFEDFVHLRLQERTLAPLRQCLLAVHTASKGEAAGAPDGACDLDALMQASNRCSAAVIEALYVFAETSVSRSRGSDSEHAQDTGRRVDGACP